MQMCFVVEDVSATARSCEAAFGWGPFEEFTADVPEASYRDWSGRKRTRVALGWAGSVQVELIHVDEGQDSVEAYQSRYGMGFQHLGVSCRSRDDALAMLESLGAQRAELLEYEALRIAFVDLPTGPAMFELLETVAAPDKQRVSPEKPSAVAPTLPLDRATLVTRDLDACLLFFGAALGWEAPVAEKATLRSALGDTEMRRYLGRAGAMTLELIEPVPGARDPYSAHLARGDHGLVHAGGALRGTAPSARPAGGLAEIVDPERAGALAGEWLETSERFTLVDGVAGASSLQIRAV